MAANFKQISSRQGFAKQKISKNRAFTKDSSGHFGREPKFSHFRWDWAGNLLIQFDLVDYFDLVDLETQWTQRTSRRLETGSTSLITSWPRDLETWDPVKQEQSTQKPNWSRDPVDPKNQSNRDWRMAFNGFFNQRTFLVKNQRINNCCRWRSVTNNY